MSLIVKSNIKSVIGEVNLGGDFADALNQKVEQLIKDACDRAKANNRKTVMAKDI